MFGVQIGSVINKIQIVAEPCPPDEPWVNPYRIRLIRAAIVPILCQTLHAKLHGTFTSLCVLGLLSRQAQACCLEKVRLG